MSKLKLLKDLGTVKKQEANFNDLLKMSNGLDIKNNIQTIYEYFTKEQSKVSETSKNVVIELINYIKDQKITVELIQNYQTIIGKSFKDFKINCKSQKDIEWQIKDCAKNIFLNHNVRDDLKILHNVFTNINNWLSSKQLEQKDQDMILVQDKLIDSFKLATLLEPWLQSQEFKSLSESYKGDLFSVIIESISDETIDQINQNSNFILSADLLDIKQNLIIDKSNNIKSLTNVNSDLIKLSNLKNLNDKSPTKNYSQIRKILEKLKCKEEEKQSLLEQYNCVKNCNYNFTLWNKQEIQEWSEANIGRLTNVDISLIIAIMDRANQIVTENSHVPEGHHLRDVQILSLLALLNNENGGQFGRLAQIATGEGKSTIVSMLAVIKALQGETIDIITSSSILAERDANAKVLFYNMFNLTVSHNKAPDIFNDEKEGTKENYKQECYKSNIVYGSVGNFQADWLKSEYHGQSILAGRIQGTVIVDEVDSMLIDNGGHMVKLSSTIAGMEYLEILFFKIWHLLDHYEKYSDQYCGKSLESKESDEYDKTGFDFLLIQKLPQEERFNYVQMIIAKNYSRVKDEIKNDIIKIIKEQSIPASNTNPEIRLLLPEHLKEYTLNLDIKNSFSARLLPSPPL